MNKSCIKKRYKLLIALLTAVVGAASACAGVPESKQETLPVKHSVSPAKASEPEAGTNVGRTSGGATTATDTTSATTAESTQTKQTEPQAGQTSSAQEPLLPLPGGGQARERGYTRNQLSAAQLFEFERLEAHAPMRLIAVFTGDQHFKVLRVLKGDPSLLHHRLAYDNLNPEIRLVEGQHYLLFATGCDRDVLHMEASVLAAYPVSSSAHAAGGPNGDGGGGGGPNFSWRTNPITLPTQTTKKEYR